MRGGYELDGACSVQYFMPDPLPCRPAPGSLSPTRSPCTASAECRWVVRVAVLVNWGILPWDACLPAYACRALLDRAFSRPPPSPAAGASSFSQYNPDLPMIQCDECKVWYHGPCIGCTDEDITDLSEVYFQCRKVTEIVWR